MIIKKLNEELHIQEGELSLILLIDHKHNRYEFFKSYEQKTFESHEIIKLNGLISEAIKIAKEALNKKPEVVKETTIAVEQGEGLVQKDTIKQPYNFPKVDCEQCGEIFERRSPRQKICPKCKELNLDKN